MDILGECWHYSIEFSQVGCTTLAERKMYNLLKRRLRHSGHLLGRISGHYIFPCHIAVHYVEF